MHPKDLIDLDFKGQIYNDQVYVTGSACCNTKDASHGSDGGQNPKSSVFKNIPMKWILFKAEAFLNTTFVNFHSTN